MTDDSAPRSLGRADLELALQAAGLGEFEWRRAGDVFVINQRTREILGLSGEVIDASDTGPFYTAVHPDDRSPLREAVVAALKNDDRFDVEFRLVRPDDGRNVWIRCAGVPVRDVEDRPQAAIGVVEDITERKLEESQRLTLMAELDHRVKNVLAAVQALAFQTAKRTTSLDSFLQTFAGRLKSMGSANTLL